VFDYIIGNRDRLKRWFDVKRHTIEDTVENNLAVLRTSPKIWLIDNEVGLLEQYTMGESNIIYHEKMIKTCCIFQRNVVERLVSLDKETSPWGTFLEFVFKHEPILRTVKEKFWERIMSKKLFTAQVRELVRWFEQCEKHQ